MTHPGYALITGASRGLGECFARALAARRRNLLLVARSRDKLAALAGQMHSSHGILVETLPFDLSSGTASDLARELRQRKLPVDLLVNNAGFAGRGKFWDLPLDRQSEMLRLNVLALIELTYHLLPAMIERREGGIINVSSMTGFQPMPYALTYAATKAFVTSFSMGLAEEVRPHGVSVVTLCPGGMRTDFLVVGQSGSRRFPGTLQSPQEVVEVALKVLQRGGGLVVPRWVNKFTVFSQRFLPRRLVARFVARMSRP